MEQRQVALLRGINVGKAKRVAMSELRATFEKLGFSGVKTLLNSGNVVYTSDGTKPAKARLLIEAAVEADLGVASLVTVRTAEEIDAVVAADPFGELATNPSRYQVAFLADESYARRLDPLLREDWGRESLALGDRVAYFWCPDGLSKSPLMEAAGKALRTGVTVRTWATVLKIQKALASE